MGASVINLSPEQSSVIKGESVEDTLRTIQALGVHAIIIRHEDDDLCFELSKKLSIPLINAGSGKRDHPSQNLLDLLTLKNEFKKLEGLTVGIIGDLKHSRVANSFIKESERCGIKVLVSGPQELIPNHLKATPLEKLIPQVDAIMCLRYQLERMKVKPDLSEFHQKYGLTEERFKQLQKHAIIMHPAPINRGIEINSSLVESAPSRIFRQMELGVFSRMAILDFSLSEGEV